MFGLIANYERLKNQKKKSNSKSMLLGEVPGKKKLTLGEDQSYENEIVLRHESSDNAIGYEVEEVEEPQPEPEKKKYKWELENLPQQEKRTY